MDKTESPMEKARVLGEKTAKPIKLAKPLKPTPLAVTSHKETVNANVNARKLWDYILPYLSQPMTTLDDPLVHKIFEHPRVRSIRWRKTWLKRTLDNDWRQVAGLLIHLVGVEFEGKVVCCTFCRRGEGPFEGCQVLPPDTSYESSKLLKSCANCFFIHRRDHCSTKDSWEKRCKPQTDAQSFSAPPIGDWAAAAAAATTSSSTTTNKRPYVEDSDDEKGEPMLSRRRSERTRVRIPEFEARGEPARNLVTFPLLSRDKQTTATGALRKSSAVAGSSSSALISAGQEDPENLLEMEEWEIAPGRIRETGVGDPNSKYKHNSFQSASIVSCVVLI